MKHLRNRLEKLAKSISRVQSTHVKNLQEHEVFLAGSFEPLVTLVTSAKTQICAMNFQNILCLFRCKYDCAGRFIL